MIHKGNDRRPLFEIRIGLCRLDAHKLVTSGLKKKFDESKSLQSSFNSVCFKDSWFLDDSNTSSNIYILISLCYRGQYEASISFIAY